MGAQWKQAGRVANATKRGQVICKLVREIRVAAKLGGSDPDLNARLYAALEAARKASVPRDTIERAVRKGAGQTGEKVIYELVTYEGFAPHKVPVIVECLTDNRNRTAPEIRHLFRTGSLGAPGSVGFFFDRRAWWKPRTQTKRATRKPTRLKPARRTWNRWKPRKFPKVTSAP